jgi:hypothetical protein
MTESARDCAGRTGEGFSPVRYFFIAKVVIGLVFVECPRKESTFATI